MSSAVPSHQSPRLSYVSIHIVKATNTALQLVERGGCRMFFPANQIGPTKAWRSIRKLNDLQTKQLVTPRERAKYVLPIVRKLLEFIENHTEDEPHSDEDSHLVPYKEALIPHLKTVISACEFFSSS